MLLVSDKHSVFFGHGRGDTPGSLSASSVMKTGTSLSNVHTCTHTNIALLSLCNSDSHNAKDAM